MDASRRDGVTLFTVGPVAMFERTRALAQQPLPYNRTAAFSERTFGILAGLRRLVATGGEVALLTCSGTGGMEAAIGSLFAPEARLVVVTGGTFGRRWADMAARLGARVRTVEPAPGQAVDPATVARHLDEHGADGLIVTAHETSSGVLHDVRALGAIARARGALFLVDAISTVLADPFELDAWQIDAAVVSSQKGLALPPGLAFVACGARALARLPEVRPRSTYLDLREHLENQKRGQTPFTPAVGLLVLLEDRLAHVFERGVEHWQARTAALAARFRAALAGLPLRQASASPSSALTALECPPEAPAGDWVDFLRDRHGIYVNPNGGPAAARGLRVGHLGDVDAADVDRLVEALHEFWARRTGAARERAWSSG
jgi:aspartate aminotransferase-like enzyme